MYFVKILHSHNRRTLVLYCSSQDSWLGGKARNDCFHANVSNIYINLGKYYAETFSESTSIETQSQHWGESRQL